METYKLGNKVKCIIRAFHAGKLGQMDMQYDLQPYTELKDVSANISFRSKDMDVAANSINVLAYHADSINQITLSDCLLTKKILELIYPSSKIKMYAKSENLDSDEKGLIYLPVNAEEIAYQVFAYNIKGELAFAAGEITDGVIKVEPNSNYVVYWYIEGKSAISLDATSTEYVTLDLTTEGNKNDNTQEMNIHLAKCAISVNKAFYLSSGHSNTVSLTFNVIQPTTTEVAEGKVNFITLE